MRNIYVCYTKVDQKPCASEFNFLIFFFCIVITYLFIIFCGFLDFQEYLYMYNCTKNTEILL